ncbi:MAG: response regulator, partial [Bacteroidota bacterium]
SQNLSAESVEEESRVRHKSVINSDVNEFLLVGACSPAKHAIPLAMVQRMEEFDRSLLEVSGDVQVVRYRDSILPIVSLSKSLGYSTEKQKKLERVSVIVTRMGTKLVGIQVEDIYDVIQTQSAINDSIHDRPGILGNIIHNDEVVVVVDVYKALSTFSFFKNSDGKKQEKRGQLKSKILFAEDTDFFRRHVGQLLTKAGYDVVTAENGKQALSFLQAPGATEEFDLILSDIEMPEMNGIELAKSIRRIDKLKKVPLVALTTRFSDASVKEGKEAGFDTYLEKLNPEQLLSEISRVLQGEERRRVA